MSTKHEAPTLVTAGMAANLIGVTPAYVYHLVKHGKLKRARPKEYLFDLVDVFKVRASLKAQRPRRPRVGEQVERVLQGVPA